MSPRSAFELQEGFMSYTFGSLESGMSDAEVKARNKKYLIFKLKDNQYGVPLSDVKEVIGLPNCTFVPGAPAYFLGLINLRGRVVSAIDLKMKMGVSMESNETKRPAVIIIEIGEITLGCVVDSINEVMSISKEQINEQLEVSVNGDNKFIKGIAHFKDRSMILLLDLKRAVDVSDLISYNSKGKNLNASAESAATTQEGEAA